MVIVENIIQFSFLQVFVFPNIIKCSAHMQKGHNYMAVCLSVCVFVSFQSTAS